MFNHIYTYTVRAKMHILCKDIQFVGLNAYSALDLLAPSGALIVMMVYYISINPLFQILSFQAFINAIDVIRCWGYLGTMFGTILGLSWDYLGTILGLSWDYLGTILGLSWD